MTAKMRLVWQEYRFEILSVVVAIGLLAIVMIAALARLQEVRPSPDCLKGWFAELDVDPTCEDSLEVWLDRAAIEAFRFIGVIPLIGGLILGSVVVSREIEHRTAQLGWSLDGSRIRWLVQRVVPLGLTLVTIAVVLAILTDLWEAARYPGIDPRSSFSEYGNRGLVLVARTMAVFSASVLVGALVARQLPAIVLSSVLALVLVWGLGLGFPYGVAGTWETEQRVATFVSSVSDVHRGSGLRSSDGEIVSYDQALSQAPAGADAAMWVNQNFEFVVDVVPGERAPEVEMRETLWLGLVVVLALGAAFGVVDRRRPY
jgi:hypothetical protein